MRRSIGTRLVVIFIVLGVGPLLIVGALFSWQSFNSQQQQTLTAQRQEVSKVAIQVDSFVRSLEEKMRMLIEVRGFQGLDRDAQKKLLSELINYDHSFDEVAMINDQGQETVRVSRTRLMSDSDLRDQTQSDEFKLPATTAEPYYSSVRVDDATGEPLITVSLPTKDYQTGKVSGVMSATIRFKPVWDLIASLSAGTTDVVYIVDDAGHVIAHRDPSVVLKGTQFQVPPQDGTFNGLDGSSVILAATKLQFGKQLFSIVAEKSAAEATALATNAAAITGLVVLIALVTATLLGLFTVRRVVRPIQDLAATAQAISAGDLSKQANVTGEDEIGDLGRAFNAMTTQLRQTLEGLQNHVSDLETARVERERLFAEIREASRLKSEFLSTMSHELRTPLNAILGFTGILLEGMAGVIDAEATHMIERVDANSKRLLGLINDILDIAKIEAGRMDVVEAPVDIRQLVDQWHTQNEVLATRKGLEIYTEVDPDLPEKLRLDREKFTQVATNLISNAIKFSERGRVDVLLTKQDKSLVLQVTDTGIGIPPHAINFIFDEFRQVDGTNRRVYGGSGLGLAIVRNLCRIMNGTVTVKSTPGVGSTFTVTIPLKPVAESQVPAATQPVLVEA